MKPFTITAFREDGSLEYLEGPLDWRYRDDEQFSPRVSRDVSLPTGRGANPVPADFSGE